MEKTKCPYCRSNIEVAVPSVKDHGAELNLCSKCHKPIAVYSCRANSMQHTDRSVKAIVVTPTIDQDTDPWLEIVENQFTLQQDYPIPMGTSILGRQNKDSSADIQVFSADPSMSRNHIKISRRKHVISIQDYESNTGTFINGRLLGRGEQAHLKDGDVLSLGALSIIVHMPNQEEEEGWNPEDFDL
ncbi:FHA domain-containing protein [Porphyromonas sp.]|uniref:FHA domain-containing protein n=1 Tax=Porphyromonas sp. TaxID=1924944 RepID=UPI0026DC1AB1|nr:FHA domain-containing protein [Porphyromonas sp.]MDO4771599.1 FHA domain-containing protein [Porphyromonas sp.]